MQLSKNKNLKMHILEDSEEIAHYLQKVLETNLILKKDTAFIKIKIDF